MSERDIEGDMTIVAGAIDKDGPPSKEEKRAIVRLLAGFATDFHRIANALEMSARNSNRGKG